MSDNNKKSVVIALGYFDSLHIGHQQVISTAVDASKKVGATPAVFSFDGNLRKVIGGADGRFVFNTAERKKLLHEMGIEEILFAPVTKGFLGRGKRSFLNYLNRIYDVKGYVSGEDYRFGYHGQGDVEYLKEYALAHAQFVYTVPAVEVDGERISTTLIKGILSLGDIERVTKLLGKSFFVTGRVKKGRRVGRTLGFPTVNIPIPTDRAVLKNGVYAGRVVVDGNSYQALLNYGDRPTFSLKEKLIEGHLIDFEGDLYGKDIKVYFDKYLRDIIKFGDVAQLKEQISRDLETVKGLNL